MITDHSSSSLIIADRANNMNGAGGRWSAGRLLRLLPPGWEGLAGGATAACPCSAGRHIRMRQVGRTKSSALLQVVPAQLELRPTRPGTYGPPLQVPVAASKHMRGYALVKETKTVARYRVPAIAQLLAKLEQARAEAKAVVLDSMAEVGLSFWPSGPRGVTGLGLLCAGIFRRW